MLTFLIVGGIEPCQVTVRGSAKYPGEKRRTDEQFQFHTRNPALVSSVFPPPVSPAKGGKGVKGHSGKY